MAPFEYTRHHHHAVRYYRIMMDTMRVDMESFIEGISDKTRVVVVNSPGNPLGNVIAQDELIRMLTILPEDTYLIFDEIYENVLFNSEQRLTPILLNHGRSDRTIVTNSCSKGYRMYTKRVGWCVLPENLVMALRIILHHTRLTVDPAVQYGAVQAIRHPHEVEDLCRIHYSCWEYARNNLKSIPGIRMLPSAGGFYFTLDCREFIQTNQLGNCLTLAITILEEAGVAIVPGEDFGLPDTLRVSFTASRFNEAIDRLKAIFQRSR